jgi:hypothetical protein
LYEWVLPPSAPNGETPAEDHDEDAIYIAVSVVLDRGEDQPGLDLGADATSLMPESLNGTLVLRPTPSPNPPLPLRPEAHCPIYLLSCALVI